MSALLQNFATNQAWEAKDADANKPFVMRRQRADRCLPGVHWAEMEALAQILRN